ncbi:MAG: hypothetical protein SOH93_01840 [Oscillospiraceae bacterium]|jgi:hypothetical protein|nr:protein of unknown function [Ruminococcaceae bacterium BL-4]
MKSKHGCVRSKYAMKKGWQIALIGFCCCAMPGAVIDPGMGDVWVQESSGEQKTLICGKEEHTHMNACYMLTCTNTDPAHVHNASCYTLICGKEEHMHSDPCYAVTMAYRCDKRVGGNRRRGLQVGEGEQTN